jgi:hypothetical protein
MEQLRPRRGRCNACRRTHVLLPDHLLHRRLDSVAVIGAALTAWSDGYGHRRIARRLRVPDSTVRDWIRRFRKRWGNGGGPADAKAALIRLGVQWPDEIGVNSGRQWRQLSLVTSGNLLGRSA